MGRHVTIEDFRMARTLYELTGLSPGWLQLTDRQRANLCIFAQTVQAEGLSLNDVQGSPPKVIDLLRVTISETLAV